MSHPERFHFNFIAVIHGRIIKYSLLRRLLNLRQSVLRDENIFFLERLRNRNVTDREQTKTRQKLVQYRVPNRSKFQLKSLLRSEIFNCT